MKWITKRIIALLLAGLYSLSTFANLPYHPIEFPRDDAAHHANVPYPVKNLTEWWYFNGKLTTETPAKQTYGYFVALFHITPPKDSPYTVLMVQLSDIDNKKVYGNRFLISDESVNYSTSDKLTISSIDSDLLKIKKDTSGYHLTLNFDKPIGRKFSSLQLTMMPVKAPLLISKYGLIEMYDNTNSYYYSQVRMKTSGTLKIDGVKYDITPDDSLSWLDHQWGDFALSPKKSRWIWSSVELNNGIDLSVFELIDPITHKVVWKLGNVIMPDDSRFYTTDIDISTSLRHKKSNYPSRYDVTIYPLNLKVRLDSLVPNQDSNGFWEGAHDVRGEYNGNPVTGFSYVENTVELQKHK